MGKEKGVFLERELVTPLEVTSSRSLHHSEYQSVGFHTSSSPSTKSNDNSLIDLKNEQPTHCPSTHSSYSSYSSCSSHQPTSVT